jgi:uncharacterized protein YbcI
VIGAQVAMVSVEGGWKLWAPRAVGPYAGRTAGIRAWPLGRDLGARTAYALGGLCDERASDFALSPGDLPSKLRTHGDVLTAISDGMVALLKEFYGNGPSRTKSYFADDLVVCVLRGGFSRVEETLLEGGRGSAVIQQRMEFQDVMRERFEEVIEQATGRPVIGFMSGNQQHPDMMCEVFILAPTDLLDEHDIPANGRSSPLG